MKNLNMKKTEAGSKYLVKIKVFEKTLKYSPDIDFVL